MSRKSSRKNLKQQKAVQAQGREKLEKNKKKREKRRKSSQIIYFNCCSKHKKKKKLVVINERTLKTHY